MNVTSSQIVNLFLTCSIIGMLTLRGSSAFSQEEQSAKSEAAGNPYSSMIEGLASRNKEPSIKHGNIGDYAVFADNYDWEEQKSVHLALVKCAKDQSDDFFEELLNHVDDKRYSLTLTTDFQFIDNYSVGRICKLLVRYRLKAPFEQHLGTDGLGKPVKLAMPLNLTAWRKERADKPLYALQLELCELAVKEVPNAKDLTERGKRLAIQGISQEIAVLRQTKRPLTTRFPLDGYMALDKKGAERMENKYRRGQDKMK